MHSVIGGNGLRAIRNFIQHPKPSLFSCPFGGLSTQMMTATLIEINRRVAQMKNRKMGRFRHFAALQKTKP
jgi:hypothetical protein